MQRKQRTVLKVNPEKQPRPVGFRDRWIQRVSWGSGCHNGADYAAESTMHQSQSAKFAKLCFGFAALVPAYGMQLHSGNAEHGGCSDLSMCHTHKDLQEMWGHMGMTLCKRGQSPWQKPCPRCAVIVALLKMPCDGGPNGSFTCL